MKHMEFPFQFDQTGETSTVDRVEHIEDMIEQIIFTAPGERVMRPDFGSGARNLVFEPNNDEVAAATEYTLRGSLEQHLGHLITLEDLEVKSEESTLSITVVYFLTGEDQSITSTFSESI